VVFQDQLQQVVIEGVAQVTDHHQKAIEHAWLFAVGPNQDL
jgi:hypothetical protein